MKQLLDLQSLITFRRIMHQYPESAFLEKQTQQRIKEYLIGLQVPNEAIRICATTGLVVDLKGDAEPSGPERLIAFRADIDALPMNEANEHLPYRSTNGCAHMCGHDGHTTCLLGFAQIFNKVKGTIPSNKTVRLLFQPAEEGHGGSVDMIREGCLDGVQEVYGCHQWPTGKIGQVWCKEGAMMSQPIQMQFEFIGKGGHASEPHKFNNPVQCGAEFLYTIHQQLGQIKDKKFTFAWTCFNGGSAFNVIPDTAVVKGMIRSLEVGLGETLYDQCVSTGESVANKYGCKLKPERLAENYPLTSNHPQEAQHILRLGEKFFGPGNAHAGPCPVYASEDFGNYTNKVPGAFFFLSSGKNDTNNPMLHQSNFDFNDDLIELGAEFCKFNDFLGLDDGRQQVQEQITQAGQRVRNIFTKEEEPRGNSFWGKMEQKWDTYKQNRNNSKSPTIQRMDSSNHERKKIFAEAAPVQRTKPLIFQNPQWGNVGLGTQPSQEIDESSLNESFQMSDEIEDMYFKNDNECEILSSLITFMGRKPSLERQGHIFENLSKKNASTKKCLSLKLMENQDQFQQGFQLHDSLAFRVSQCCARIGRTRMILRLLRETHRDLGLRIQKKQQKKAELEQQLANVVRFRQKYQSVFELIRELGTSHPEESWPLYKVIAMKDLIWTQTRDSKEQMQLYVCFSDLRGYIEGLFQQQLENAYRFFTQNIVQVFVTNRSESLYRTLSNMCDYLQQYELNNKSVDMSKQIRTSLQSQFRSLLRTHIEYLPKNTKLLKRGLKFDCLHSLNIYLSAFVQSFYLTSFALGQIVQAFQRLLQSSKQALLKKIGFQYNIEKNQFWQYIQDKLVKSIRHTKLEAGCTFLDWIKFETLLFRILQIGEELSNLKSDTILVHLKSSLRFIAQGISSAVMQCLSVQKGVGVASPIKPQYQSVLLNKLDQLFKTRRLNASSNYLATLIDSKDLLPSFEQAIPLKPIESLYNKREEYYFVVSQLQELLLFADNIPSYKMDCLLHTIHCFEYYCYLLIKNDLNQQIKQLLEDDIEEYHELQQMLAKQIDSIRSSGLQIQVVYISTCLREIVENLALTLQICDFISKSFNDEDKDFIEQNMSKAKCWLQQLQNFWIYQQSKKDISIENRQLSSYQIMYKMTQIFHQISVQTMNNRTIKTADIERVYFHSYIEIIIAIARETVCRDNKLYVQAELLKFQKQLGEQYKSGELDVFVKSLNNK